MFSSPTVFAVPGSLSALVEPMDRSRQVRLAWLRKYVSGTYYVPGTVLGAEDTELSVPAFLFFLMGVTPFQ